MSSKDKAKILSEPEIDQIVIAQANGDSAWEKLFAFIGKSPLLSLSLRILLHAQHFWRHYIERKVSRNGLPALFENA